MDCIFCKIVSGEIPCSKIYESDNLIAFLDISPLSIGHTLVIPKFHSEKLHELPDEYLIEILPLLKKIAIALNIKDYNLLQNNGARAHQAVNHMHFHIIPKTESHGLKIEWDPIIQSSEELKNLAEKLINKI
ncbi:MAG: HIT-like protein [Candidatus Heimdallarchaeota archaeon LC_3]|nr:MAG: HIT-like protein [Candidatus Heimdallarchaeota archaeon LC_3]